MKSCSSLPTGSSANAVTIAVSSPKQRFSPRATLYSPPPSYTSNRRGVAMRPSAGSKRSITSPRLTRSQRHSCFGLIFSPMLLISTSLPDVVNCDERCPQQGIRNLQGYVLHHFFELLLLKGLFLPQNRNFLMQQTQ